MTDFLLYLARVVDGGLARHYLPKFLGWFDMSAGDVSLKSGFILLRRFPMCAAFPRSEYYQRIRLRTVASAFLRNDPYRPAYSIRFVHGPRPQWISQVP